MSLATLYKLTCFFNNIYIKVQIQSQLIFLGMASAIEPRNSIKIRIDIYLLHNFRFMK